MAIILKYCALMFMNTPVILNQDNCLCTHTYNTTPDSLCQKIKLIQYYIHNNIDTLESGIIVKNKHIKCHIEIENDSYLLFFNGIKAQPYPLYFNCEDINNNEIFNTFKDGTKTGIWIKWYPWGKIKSATMYVNNKPDRIVKFNIIGNISQLIIHEKKRLRYIFYKNGYPKEQLKSFY